MNPEREFPFAKVLPEKQQVKSTVGYLKFFNLKKKSSSFEQSEMCQRFDNIKEVHNLKPYEDFSCYRSFLDWKRMLTENKELFIKVTQALSSDAPAPSVPYERLEAEVAAFVQKYF